MPIYTAELIAEKIRLHALWLKNDSEGVRFELESSADLRSANLSSADLSSADLSSADLSSANLSYADLRYADLSSADLSSADLRYANLSSADLRYADLRSANLSYADLSSANLSYADLRYAKIEELSASQLAPFRNCPESGAFIAFKKLRGGYIAQLQIPASAKRVNALGSRKCRANTAKVVAIFDALGEKKLAGIGTTRFPSKHDPSFTYQLGQVLKVENFNDDIRIECAAGIHFFITKQEALDY